MMLAPIERLGYYTLVQANNFAYHAVPTNLSALSAFRYYVARIWLRTLRRRSQKDKFAWERIEKLADDWLPQPRILHCDYSEAGL